MLLASQLLPNTLIGSKNVQVARLVMGCHECIRSSVGESYLKSCWSGLRLAPDAVAKCLPSLLLSLISMFNNRESRPLVDFFEAEKRLNFAPKQPLRAQRKK